MRKVPVLIEKLGYMTYFKAKRLEVSPELQTACDLHSGVSKRLVPVCHKGTPVCPLPFVPGVETTKLFCKDSVGSGSL